MTQPIRATGMAWFKRENFDLLRTMFKDGHKLHRTYDEWLVAAETGRKKLEVEGTRIVRVNIDPDKFPVWCEAQGMELNAAARTRYAGLVAYQVLTGLRAPDVID